MQPSDPPRRSRRRRVDTQRKKAPAEFGLRPQGSGTPVSELDSQRFLRALEYVLSEEQGYANHPDDPGGSTRYGITQGFHDTWDDHPGPITPRHPNTQEATQLYHGLWQRLNQRAPEGLTNAEQLARFDTAVLHGENSNLLQQPSLDSLLAARERKAGSSRWPGHLDRVARLRDEAIRWGHRP